MPSLVGGGKKAGAPSGKTLVDKPVSILKGPAKRKSTMTQDTDNATTEVRTPTNRAPSKNARPEGTSPMAQDKLP
jgi:hypothetical protein